MLIVIQKNVNTLSIEKQTVLRVKIAEFRVPEGIRQSSFTQKGSILVGLGDGIFAELPPGADGEYLQWDSNETAGIKSAVPSIDVNDTTNHLINGGFTFAQRQTPGTLTTISDGSYGPDRWKMTRENADLQYRRVDASGESGLVSPYYGEFKKITNAGKMLVCQPLEYLDTLKFRGKVVGFQLQMKASSAKTMKIAIVELQAGGTADTLPTLVSAWGADGTDPTLGANLAVISTPVSCSVTTAWQTFQFTGTFPSNSKNLLVMVWSNADFAANDTLGVAEGGMYFGESQRSWTPQHISKELELCQRYFQKSYLIDTVPGTASYTSAPYAYQYSIYPTVLVFFPVWLRITPTITTYGPVAGATGKIRIDAGDVAATVASSGQGFFSVYPTTAVALAGHDVQVHYTVSAEL